MIPVHLQLESLFFAIQPCLHLIDDIIDFLRPYDAFPDNAHSPLGFCKITLIPEIPRHVSFELSLPELGSCCGRSSVATTLMAMPEASVNEERRAKPGKYEVRTAGKILRVQSISNTPSVQCTAQG